jgi:hypothetical protein
MTRHLTSRVLAVVALLSPVGLGADFDLDAPSLLAAGPDPALVAAADLTQDGRPDLLVSSGSGARLRVFVNQGDLGFSAPVLTELPAMVFDWDIADMDGDGKPDLVVSREGSVHALDVLLGDGQGGFTLTGSLDLSGTVFAPHVVLADMDGDGHTDAAIGQGGHVRVSLGDGAGGLLPPGSGQPHAGYSVRDLHGVDAEGDGDTDLLVVTDWNWGFDWDLMLGDGRGGLSLDPGPSEGSCDSWTRGSAVGDLNGDQRPDLAVSFYDYCWFWDDGDLQLGLSDGATIAGTFPGDVTSLPLLFSELAIADMDGDGFGDVVGTRGWSIESDLWVLLGNGDGSLQPPTSHAAGGTTGRLALSDLDGDTVPDVVATLPGDGALAILHNTSLPPGWSDAGAGLSGALGVPRLDGVGLLVEGEQVQLSLGDGLPLAPAGLVFGFTQASVPFKGGVMVPAPDLVLDGLQLTAAGSFEVDGFWPAGVPAGLTTWWQMWIVDAAGPKGLSASNGLAAKAQPF